TVPAQPGVGLGAAVKRFLLVALVSVRSLSAGLGQDKKKPEKKVEPQVLMAIPLGAAPGSTVRFTSRGFKLDNATAVRSTHDQVAAKLISQGRAPGHDKNPDKVGDTQDVVEAVLPDDLPAGPLEFLIETKEGNTKTHVLLIEKDRPLIKEKEPNDG